MNYLISSLPELEVVIISKGIFTTWHHLLQTEVILECIILDYFCHLIGKKSSKAKIKEVSGTYQDEVARICVAI